MQLRRAVAVDCFAPLLCIAASDGARPPLADCRRFCSRADPSAATATARLRWPALDALRTDVAGPSRGKADSRQERFVASEKEKRHSLITQIPVHVIPIPIEFLPEKEVKKRERESLALL